jgi:hypothetical protein
MNNPANAFTDTKSVDYAAVVATVQGIKPRALTPGQYDDVIKLIEWMQEQCVTLHGINEQRVKVLDTREKSLEARERDVAIRQRALNVAEAMRKVSRYFGR